MLVIQPRSSACSPYSPKDRRLPDVRHALARLPRCMLAVLHPFRHKRHGHFSFSGRLRLGLADPHLDADLAGHRCRLRRTRTRCSPRRVCSGILPCLYAVARAPVPSRPGGRRHWILDALRAHVHGHLQRALHRRAGTTPGAPAAGRCSPPPAARCVSASRTSLDLDVDLLAGHLRELLAKLLDILRPCGRSRCPAGPCGSSRGRGWRSARSGCRAPPRPSGAASPASRIRRSSWTSSPKSLLSANQRERQSLLTLTRKPIGLTF